jgi:hypothetical protein
VTAAGTGKNKFNLSHSNMPPKGGILLATAQTQRRTSTTSTTSPDNRQTIPTVLPDQDVLMSKIAAMVGSLVSTIP